MIVFSEDKILITWTYANDILLDN